VETCEDGEGLSFLPDGRRAVYTRATGKEQQLPGWGGQIEHSDIVVRDMSGANLRVVLIRSRPFHADYRGDQSRGLGNRCARSARMTLGATRAFRRRDLVGT
jgi:hypothetical protein